MITVHQVKKLSSTSPNGRVPAIVDRRLYNFLVGGGSGVVEGCEVTPIGSTQIRVADGWGIASGCMFTVENEIVDAVMSPSGTVQGQLYLQIDVSQSTAAFLTTAVTPRPAMTQEDLTAAGNIYEMQFAIYDVDELAVSNLQQTFEMLVIDTVTQADLAAVRTIATSAQSTANAAQTAAGKALPKAGGTMSGTVDFQNRGNAVRFLANGSPENAIRFELNANDDFVVRRLNSDGGIRKNIAVCTAADVLSLPLSIINVEELTLAGGKNHSGAVARNCAVVSSGSSPTANLVSTNSLVFSRS